MPQMSGLVVITTSRSREALRTLSIRQRCTVSSARRLSARGDTKREEDGRFRLTRLNAVNMKKLNDTVPRQCPPARSDSESAATISALSAWMEATFPSGSYKSCFLKGSLSQGLRKAPDRVPPWAGTQSCG